MTRHEIEESLEQFNTMVHDTKSFKPNCLCKFTWEDEHGKDVYIFIDDAKSHEDLIRIIKAQMFIHKVDSSIESDLIINYWLSKAPDKDNQMYDNIRIIPLTLEEFIKQKVPVEHKDKIDEIKDNYITYLVTNKNKHHYGNHEYMHKWLSNEFYQYAKSQY